VRLKVTKFPQSRDELGQSTADVTPYLREFIGGFQIWNDFFEVTERPHPDIFDASRAASIYGKILGLRRAVVQVNVAKPASATLGNWQQPKLEDQKVPVILVHKAEEALKILGNG
jgi:hypothetical protein